MIHTIPNFLLLSMRKSLLILFLIVVLLGISSRIIRADNSSSHISSTPDIFDHGTFHVARYKSDAVIQSLGLIGGKLLASFSVSEHAWDLNGTFTPVQSEDPIKALGYSTAQSFTAEKYAEAAKINSTTKACDKLKDVVAQDEIVGANICLTATAGGDFTVHLMPGDIKWNIGFGKQPIVKGTRIYWIGYDGNLYIASLHPSAFTETVSAIKSKTNPVVFLVRNKVRFQIPDEKTYFTWFPSFQAVKISTAKQLASYPLLGKISYRANTLIKFKGEPTVYAYQPPNNPYVKYGKDVKIIEETNTAWTLLPPRSKKNETMTKVPEQLLPILTESDIVEFFGPHWKKQIIELDLSQKAKYSISTKPYAPTWNISAQ